ncbi:MAG: hypothetical protein N4A35_05680 [Flavobacteriales bacterium]|jgi:succinate dehydrogenase/fumarate reductase cytochrome b subunit|nr:hypothetical protein [Flavobacteriales bacterium]
MKNLHRLSGIIVSLFIIVHLTNHLMAWLSIESHQHFLETARTIYQHPLVEPFLLACFAFQSISGTLLFFKLRKNSHLSTSDKIQMYSGLILGVFLLQHISVSVGQRILTGLDTNFYFAANVVLKWPLKLYFIPYYFLGIFSLGLHVANTHRIKISTYIGIRKANLHFYIIVITFTAIAIIILYLLMGGHYPIEMPEQYLY